MFRKRLSLLFCILLPGAFSFAADDCHRGLMNPTSADYARIEGFKISLRNKLDELIEEYEEGANDVLIDINKSVRFKHSMMGVPEVGESLLIAAENLRNADQDRKGPSSDIQKIYQNFDTALDTDPYLVWLSNHGLKNEPPMSDADMIMRLHVYGRAPHSLPFEYAMLRIYRDFDPTLSVEERERIDHAMNYRKILWGLAKIKERMNGYEGGSPELWGLATSADDALENFGKLNEQLNENLGGLCSAPCFLRLKNLYKSGGAASQLAESLRIFWFQNPSMLGQIPSKFESLRLELIRETGLPKNITSQQILLVDQAIRHRAGDLSYYEFLIRIAPFPKSPVAPVDPSIEKLMIRRADTWYALRDIIRLQDAVEDQDQFHGLLLPELKNVTFLY